MADWFGEAAKYFGKKKAGKDPTIEKMEEAIGVTQPMSVPPIPSVPPVPPIPPEKKLRDRSTKGSPPFSDAELKQGFRKMGKGLK